VSPGPHHDRGQRRRQQQAEDHGCRPGAIEAERAERIIFRRRARLVPLARHDGGAGRGVGAAERVEALTERRDANSVARGRRRGRREPALRPGVVDEVGVALHRVDAPIERRRLRFGQRRGEQRAEGPGPRRRVIYLHRCGRHSRHPTAEDVDPAVEDGRGEAVARGRERRLPSPQPGRRIVGVDDGDGRAAAVAANREESPAHGDDRVTRAGRGQRDARLPAIGPRCQQIHRPGLGKPRGVATDGEDRAVECGGAVRAAPGGERGTLLPAVARRIVDCGFALAVRVAERQEAVACRHQAEIAARERRRDRRLPVGFGQAPGARLRQWQVWQVAHRPARDQEREREEHDQQQASEPAEAADPEPLLRSIRAAARWHYLRLLFRGHRSPLVSRRQLGTLRAAHTPKRDATGMPRGARSSTPPPGTPLTFYYG
jgi:hypothetical protein